MCNNLDVKVKVVCNHLRYGKNGLGYFVIILFWISAYISSMV
jgi:hypothetical protein